MFTAIPGAYRVRLGSTHPDRYGALSLFSERHNHLGYQAWEAQKKEHVALDDSIPSDKNYCKQISSVFKLSESALQSSKRINYKYACVSRLSWHLKTGIKNFREKNPGSIIILKVVNDLFRVWK